MKLVRTKSKAVGRFSVVVCYICFRGYQHEFDQTAGGSGGQRCLACSGLWGHEESDTTKRLNNNNNNKCYKSTLRDLRSNRYEPCFCPSLPPPAISDFLRDYCDQPLDVGCCNKDLPRFYYDYSSRTCKPFNYGGCAGNRNNFETENECLWACAITYMVPVAVPLPILPPGTIPKKCTLTPDYGKCKTFLTQFYYDVKSKICFKFIFSGCGNNENNFHSFRESRFSNVICSGSPFGFRNVRKLRRSFPLFARASCTQWKPHRTLRF
uniref:BPTI/Kunitz inhibitor domain-containing protein n=1 Tax=Podarcis muralis TaxID=64176 RepID=A0A670K6R8_PODMU